MKRFKTKLSNAFYAVLCVVLEFQIKYDMFNHRNVFKNGDLVRYNWKARTFLDSAISHEEQNKVVQNYLYKDNSGIEFTDGNNCDPFWVSKR